MQAIGNSKTFCKAYHMNGEQWLTWREGARRMVPWLDERKLIENSDDYAFADRVIEAWERLSTMMVDESAA